MNVYITHRSNLNKQDTSSQILELAYKDFCGKKIDITKIHKNQYGKPYYDDNFFYNISHSKNYICIATSENEVGIDIEEPRRVDPELSNKILAENEAIISGNILNNWVIKEAFSKFCGMGLCMDFKNINAAQLLSNASLINLSTDDYFCYLYSANTEKALNIYIDKWFN